MTERELERVPTKASYAVGKYEDGSGPVVTVEYDAEAARTADMVWIISSGDQWVAFPWQHADEVAHAILTAAAALRAQSTKGRE